MRMDMKIVPDKCETNRVHRTDREKKGDTTDKGQRAAHDVRRRRRRRRWSKGKVSFL